MLADDWSFSEIPFKAAGLAGRYLFWFVCLNSTRGEYCFSKDCNTRIMCGVSLHAPKIIFNDCHDARGSRLVKTDTTVGLIQKAKKQWPVSSFFSFVAGKEIGV